MKCHLFRSALICLLVVCLLASFLPGCGQVKNPGENTKPSSAATAKPTEQEKVTLRIAVEESLSGALDDSFHTFLKKHKSEFSLLHGNVEIVIEKIPKTDGREEVLKRLRAELMMGEGPDILLLPSQPTDSGDFFGFLEPLVPDVQQGMRNGLFLDISAYYDGDTELDKDGLNQTVMDAGLLGDGRYVLPLCYNLPVAYVNKNAFAESGVPQDLFAYGAVDLLNAIAQIEDLSVVGSLRNNYCVGAPLSFNFFSQLIDYETGKVSVTVEELEAYLRAWQAYRLKLSEAIDAGYGVPDLAEVQYCYGKGNYAFPGVFWGVDGYYASCNSLLEAADTVLMARSLGVELDMYPLRAIDGSVVADVTFYGAISYGSRNPELAYEFLRFYLTPEFQTQSSGLYFYGWPVRTVGSLAPKCERLGDPLILSTEGMRIINTENVTDEEMPILDARIDCVRFPILLETAFADTVADLYDYREQAAVEVDFREEAEDWVRILQNHIDES